MNGLFLRLYLSIAGATLAAAIGVFALDRASQPWGPVDPALWTEALAATRVAFAEDPAPIAAQRVESRYRVHVELVAPDAPPPPEASGARPAFAVPQREVTLDDGRRARLTWTPPPPALGAPAVALLAFLGAGAVLLRWLRGLERALGELVEAALRFGQRELSARVVEDGAKPTGVLDTTFNQMAQRVEALVQAQQDLLVGVSHELRTPLMRMRFAVELLPDLRDPAERARRAADIQADIDEVDALIGEILTFARLSTSDELHPEDLACAALLEQVADETRRLVPDRLVVVTPCDVRVHADRRLLLRALRNLATNAVRHGRGTICLHATQRAGEVGLFVDDEGPGIAPADRERVLAPFVRLDPARSDGGVGLGLALVDRVAKLHGGRVEIGGEGLARVGVVVERV